MDKKAQRNFTRTIANPTSYVFAKAVPAIKAVAQAA